MTAKTSAARRAAFFAALAATGNRTLACERARVSQSWVGLHAREEPGFRAAMDAAIAQARASLDTRRANGQGIRPSAKWRAQEGEELVVRGTNGRRVQIARARLRQWSPRVEARFLARLAATCNVKAACAAVGLTQASAYNHYRRWPGFARLWDEALETGAVRLEMALVENTCNLFSPRAVAPDLDMPGIGFDDAIRLLRLHQRRLHGFGKQPGRMPRAPSQAEVTASILRKIEAIERGDALRAAEAAARAERAARRAGGGGAG
jgi:hypothetical protein